MTIPYHTDHGLRNAVLLELAGNVSQATGTRIANSAGETHPNWVMFLNRIIAAVNSLGGAPIPTFLHLDYGAFDSVVKAVQAKLNTPPTNTVAPTISYVTGGGGAGTQPGAQYVSNNGTWTGNPTYTRQWLRNGANIAGQTATSYTTAAADSGTSISCRVTGTNAGGSASATSNAVAIT